MDTFETIISTTQDTTVILKSIQYYIEINISRLYLQVMVPPKPKLLGQKLCVFRTLKPFKGSEMNLEMDDMPYLRPWNI